MSDRQIRVTASIGFVVGAVLGMAGTFAPSASLRGLAWGVDGVALVVAAALLVVFHFRKGNDLVAGGYLVFAIGEALILTAAAAPIEASVPAFGAGVALWAAALALVSAPKVLPVAVRAVGLVASLLFAAHAVQVFLGVGLTPLSTPLPFFAYPFLAATLLGWAWVHLKLAV